MNVIQITNGNKKLDLLKREFSICGIKHSYYPMLNEREFIKDLSLIDDLEIKDDWFLPSIEDLIEFKPQLIEFFQLQERNENNDIYFLNFWYENTKNEYDIYDLMNDKIISSKDTSSMGYLVLISNQLSINLKEQNNV